MRWPKLSFSKVCLPIILLVLAVVIGWKLPVFVKAPYVWVSLSWFVVIVLLLRLVANTKLKVVLVNLGAVVFALTAYEAYLYKNTPAKRTRYEDIYKRYYQLNHPFLGYAPNKNVVRPSARKYYNDRLVYDVAYTIGENRLRISMSGERAKDLHGCILFFGGSYTFGEGVNDNESMPYQVDLLTKKRYRIFNFGLHGYGPHQMLSALEHGYVKRIAPCDAPTTVIYQTHSTHVRRAARLASWDTHGP